MNINIEKISNGFILTIDGKKSFHDVPEAICGALAEWALAECKNATEDTQDKMKEALKLMRQQQEGENPPAIEPWSLTRYLLPRHVRQSDNDLLKRY